MLHELLILLLEIQIDGNILVNGHRGLDLVLVINKCVRLEAKLYILIDYNLWRF